MVNRLVEIYNSKKPYDAIVIVRGGGSQSDFLIYDSYLLAKAVSRFPIPVITGIGHTKNESIVDMMAHSATKTPTKAAEMIIAHNHAFENDLLSLQKTIVIKTQQLFSSNFQTLSTLNSVIVNNTRGYLNFYKDELTRINQITINTSKDIIYRNQNNLRSLSSQLLTKPKMTVYNRLSDIEGTINHLKVFSANYLKNQKGYLGHYHSVVRLMSPINILKKGFAIVKSNGKITSNPDDIMIGKDITVILSDKEITSTVKTKKEYNGSEFEL